MKPSLSGRHSVHTATSARSIAALKRPTFDASVVLSLLGAAILFFPGCRTPQSQTLLERENFQQEKCIEDLRDQVDEVQHDLDQCRRENAAMRRRLGEGTVVSPGTAPIIVGPPTVVSPQSTPNFEPPTIDRGSEVPPATLPPSGSPRSRPRSESPGSEAPPALPPSSSPPPALPNSSQEQWQPPKDATEIDQPAPGPTDAALTTSSYLEESPEAERISIIRLLTNGHQFGGHAAGSYNEVSQFGDNGLQVAFASRDAENRAAPAEGSVAIVVVDPQLSGPEARVARWDFTAAEAQAHYRQTLMGKAYRFDLLWPHDPPRHDRLKLFVRMTTSDGRRLESEQTLYVKLGAPSGAAEDAIIADEDSPAPADEPARAELVSTRAAPRADTEQANTRQADMGQAMVTQPDSAHPESAQSESAEFEPDDPAPADGAGASSAPPRSAASPPSGAPWRPDRQ